jgi:hypothetical protein
MARQIEEDVMLALSGLCRALNEATEDPVKKAEYCHVATHITENADNCTHRAADLINELKAVVRS